MGNKERREALVARLVTEATAEIDNKLPGLIDAAETGLRSLSEVDEITKIRDLKSENENLVDQLEGLSMMGDAPQTRNDTNAAARKALLASVETKIRDGLSGKKDAVNKKLNVTFCQGAVLDTFEERLDGAGDYYQLLCNVAGGK
ncbi:hypothetical protein MOV66_00570 [Agrobacterium sp. SHOUNA12C]|nr:hypothetical protein [Agrobacterium sp. BETTINA12B]MCJ9755128.1 hypothetical protein [Agrobacterium sp. SHOUNA12C]